MPKDGQQSLLNFVSTLSAPGKQCEFVNTSTERSWPQQRGQWTVKAVNSASPSSSTKRKWWLTAFDQEPKKRKSMSQVLVSPNKLVPELQSLRDEICADTHALNEPLKASIDALLQIKGAWETGLKECQEIKCKNMELQHRIAKIEEDNKRLTSKVHQLEDRLLEGNIIFQGIPEQLWEAYEVTKEKVLTAVSHTISGTSQEDRMQQARMIPTKDVQRIGRHVVMKTRPVLVEFCHKANAEFLLSNRSHIPKGVYIDKQFSDETERERRKLWPILKAARQHENYQGKCKMEGPILIIKGKNYTTKNLYQLPEEINGFKATSKCEGNVLGFFRELNPLSNFHPTPFTINAQRYHSSEQYIQHQKCLLFGDKQTEQSILTTTSALECKVLSKDINKFDVTTWKENAYASCTPGILAKFEQHPTLTKLWLSTGNKQIVECCKDKDWGTGIPLFDQNALSRNIGTCKGC